MKKQTGRKAIILLTDGEDNGSKVTLAEAVSSAQRADTLAYSVRIADQEENFQGFPGPGMRRRGGWGGRGGGYGRGPVRERPDGKKILEQISKETGGAYFEVSKKNTVEDIYKDIQEDLRNQYSIGYTPDRPDTEGGYRKIQVKVNRKDVTVQARDGYYAGSKSNAS
jgi:VWFA-related protein